MPVLHRWLIELRDARSKPSSARRHTDQEHGAAALGRWRRHQHIVNPEVAVGRQRDPRNVRTELGEGRRGFTNQRREDAGVAVRRRSRPKSLSVHGEDNAEAHLPLCICP